MIGLNFGRWSHAAGRVFIKDRIYFKGWKWTPFIKIKFRYHFKHLNSIHK